MRAAAVIWAMVAGAALAQAPDLPVRPDGSLDTDAVIGSFSMQRELRPDGAGGMARGPGIAGTIVGQDWTGEIRKETSSGAAVLLLRVGTASGDLHSLVATLVNDARCRMEGLAPRPVDWVRAARGADGWQVAVACERAVSPGS